MSNITTCLWFEKEAEEAAHFYVALFKKGGRKAKIGTIAHYGKSSANASGRPKGSVLTVMFELDGSSFMGLNGGPAFSFSQATSFIIFCKTQKEIDYFWEKLSDGGEEGQCGWINHDKYGISWQIVPDNLSELVAGPDPVKSENFMKAMLKMKKLDISALEKAAKAL